MDCMPSSSISIRSWVWVIPATVSYEKQATAVSRFIPVGGLTREVRRDGAKSQVLLRDVLSHAGAPREGSWGHRRHLRSGTKSAEMARHEIVMQGGIADS